MQVRSSLPKGQDWLTKKSKTWLESHLNAENVYQGIRVSLKEFERGVCHGYAHLATLLSWDRLKEILSILNTLSIETLCDSITHPQHKYLYYLSVVKERMSSWTIDDINSHYQSLQYYAHHNEVINNADTVETLAKRKRFILDNDVNKYLTPRDKLLLTLPAFIESLWIAQSPEVFAAELLGVIARGQETSLMLPLMMPEDVMSKGGIYFMPIVSVCISRDELMQMLEMLANELKLRKACFDSVNDKVSLLLFSHDHTINISFYPHAGVWRVFDINDVELADLEIPSNQLQRLSDLVFTSFGLAVESSPYITFSMQIASLGVHAKQVASAFNQCCESDLWKKMNEVTHEKAIAKIWKSNITWLYHAAKSNHVEVVKNLVTQHADVNSVWLGNGSPLFIAARNGFQDVVRILLDHGALIDQAGNDGATALFIAAQMGHGLVVKMLLESRANVELATKQEGGVTPLCIALCRQHIEVARLLIQHHANVNRTFASLGGSTLLHYAAYHGQLESVKLLCDSGALINQLGPDTSTPLFVAAQYGRLEVVRYLLAKGANPAIAFDSTYQKLHEFTLLSTQDVQLRVREFLERHSQSKSSHLSVTAYDIAIMMGHHEVAEVLRLATLKSMFHSHFNYLDEKNERIGISFAGYNNTLTKQIVEIAIQLKNQIMACSSFESMIQVIKDAQYAVWALRWNLAPIKSYHRLLFLFRQHDDMLYERRAYRDGRFEEQLMRALLAMESQLVPPDQRASCRDLINDISRHQRKVIIDKKADDISLNDEILPVNYSLNPSS